MAEKASTHVRFGQPVFLPFHPDPRVILHSYMGPKWSSRTLLPLKYLARKSFTRVCHPLYSLQGCHFSFDHRKVEDPRHQRGLRTVCESRCRAHPLPWDFLSKLFHCPQWSKDSHVGRTERNAPILPTAYIPQTSTYDTNRPRFLQRFYIDSMGSSEGISRMFLSLANLVTGLTHVFAQFPCPTTALSPRQVFTRLSRPTLRNTLRTRVCAM